MYLRRRGWTDADEFAILTAAGPIRPRITWRPTCTRRHGPRARRLAPTIPPARRTAAASSPPAAAAGASSTSRSATRSARSRRRTSELERSTCRRSARRSSTTRCSQPHQRVLVPPLEPGRIRARIFERGVGETLCRGTGASGAAVAHVSRGGLAGHGRARRRRARGRGRRGSAGHPDRLGGARVRGHARRRLPQGAR